MVAHCARWLPAQVVQEAAPPAQLPARVATPTTPVATPVRPAPRRIAPAFSPVERQSSADTDVVDGLFDRIARLAMVMQEALAVKLVQEPSAMRPYLVNLLARQAASPSKQIGTSKWQMRASLSSLPAPWC